MLQTSTKLLRCVMVHIGHTFHICFHHMHAMLYKATMILGIKTHPLFGYLLLVDVCYTCSLAWVAENRRASLTSSNIFLLVLSFYLVVTSISNILDPVLMPVLVPVRKA
jgi:hypothetical protein